MKLDISPMLNAYPDSMGGTLHDIVQLLARPEFENVFGSFYILPSVFNTDLDRGFSVIDYTLNRELAGPQDMEGLKALGLKLKLDFILNHASVLSPQFQDLLKNGKSSAYRDFFIDWNDFWQGCGSMTEQGYIQPEAKYLEKMFFRKPGLPILMVRLCALTGMMVSTAGAATAPTPRRHRPCCPRATAAIRSSAARRRTSGKGCSCGTWTAAPGCASCTPCFPGTGRSAGCRTTACSTGRPCRWACLR